MTRVFCLFLLLMLSVAVVNAARTNVVRAINLKCEPHIEQADINERGTDPRGPNSPKPRLSWTFITDDREARGQVQSAYRILVASTPALLRKNQGDLWDSGRVTNAEQNNITYSGKRLESGQICHWKVQIWSGDAPPTWSQPASWEMGLLDFQDWTGTWTSDGKPNPTSDADFYKDDPAPLFRKEFELRGPVKRARLAISGLGYYAATLNAQPISGDVLQPGWTKVDKRTTYQVYDVTKLLAAKQNCLGVSLGNGWYNPLPLKLFGAFDLRKQLTVGRPRFLVQLTLEYLDGSTHTIFTDKSWRVTEGPILRNNIYLGEVVDARREPTGWNMPGFDDSQWGRAAVVNVEPKRLWSSMEPPIRITDQWNAVRVTEPKPGTFIYDFGVNFAGWARLNLNLPSGTKVNLRYGELLHKDGTLNPMTSVAGQIKGVRQGTNESIGGPGAPPIAWQADTYIARGGGKETYTPQFTFHAFRYMEVTGIPAALPLKDVTALRLNSDVKTVGAFECSNPMLNQVQEMCVRTFKSNIFSVQSDCPHRERLGYGGDIVATSEAFMSNFDMSGFYSKAVFDWSDSALPDGMFTDTAPYIGIQYCGFIWAMAHPLLVDQLYQYYGDRAIGEHEYVAAKRWLALVEAKYPEGIVTEGLSDHESLVGTPSAELVTPLYYQTATLMSGIATRLGFPKDAAHFTELAGKIQTAYLSKFVDSRTGKVGPGTQASQSIALYTKILPAEVRALALAYLISDIDGQKGHLTTGILGTKFMLDVLSREGRADVAYRIATQTDFPGWGWMLKNDATTLWEHWELSDNTFSHNHPMFGSISQWMMQWLGGIQPASDAVGYDQIVIRPQAPAGLDWVKSSYQSVRGPIVSNWMREGSGLRFEIEIPVNSQARVTLPVSSGQKVLEGGKPLASAPGVQKIARQDTAVQLDIGSGKYMFTVVAQ